MIKNSFIKNIISHTGAPKRISLTMTFLFHFSERGVNVEVDVFPKRVTYLSQLPTKRKIEKERERKRKGRTEREKEKNRGREKERVRMKEQRNQSRKGK